MSEITCCQIMNNLWSIQNKLKLESEECSKDFDFLSEFCLNPTNENKQRLIERIDANRESEKMEQDSDENENENEYEMEGISENVNFSKTKQKAINMKTSKQRIMIHPNKLQRIDSAESDRSISNSSIEVLNNRENNYISTDDDIQIIKSSQIPHQINIKYEKKTKSKNVIQRVNKIGMNREIEMEFKPKTFQNLQEMDYEFEDDENDENAYFGDIENEQGIEISDCDMNDLSTERETTPCAPLWCNNFDIINKKSEKDQKINPLDLFGECIDLIIDLTQVFPSDIPLSNIDKPKSWNQDRLTLQEIHNYSKFMGWQK